MTEKRKQSLMILLPVLVCLIGMIGVTIFLMHVYRHAVLGNISQFCEMLVEDHPELEAQVVSNVKKYFLTAKNDNFFTSYDARLAEPLFPARLGGGGVHAQDGHKKDFLAQYGYGSSEFSDGVQKNLIILMTALFFVTIFFFLFSIWYLDRRNRVRINELTNYLEQVNIGADGTLIQAKEDQFSHLQDELYKTVTTLYQTREAAVAAKVNFAENLANIAHQLKTPITACSLSLQMMEKENPSQYARQIKKQLGRLNRLEESLLMLARIDAGTLQLEHSQVDVYTALCLAADDLNDLLVKENISVSIPEKNCVAFCGDLEWTMEACINLMKNCMEHSPAGGTIHCEYSQNPLYVEILMWDEGKGFAMCDIPHLFERFYRGEGAVGDGVGIGLALSRSIFALQNGTITARNLPEGGACFEIRIYSH